MSGPLKSGDCVRVSVRNRLHGYQPGDTGTVLYRAFTQSMHGERFYFYAVAMDKDDAGKRTVFTEHEIEPDV